MYNTSHHITSFHHILHCTIPHQTQSLTLFQITPHSTSDHHSSPYHTFHIKPTPLAAHYSVLQYHISNRCIGHTFHIKHHLRLYSKSHHIPHQTIIPHHITHFISHQHLSQHTIPFCNTIFQITVSATLYASHHISH